MTDAERTYTHEQTMRAIRSAFRSGMRWAETYTSWWTPYQAEHDKNEKDAISRALKAARRPK